MKTKNNSVSKASQISITFGEITFVTNKSQTKENIDHTKLLTIYMKFFILRRGTFLIEIKLIAVIKMRLNADEPCKYNFR